MPDIAQSSTSPALSPPSLLRRLAAMVYDLFLVTAVVALVNALALGALVAVSGGSREVLPPALVQVLTVVTVVGFYTLFWRKQGQTLGMQAWRLQLVDFQGNLPGTSRCLLRCGAALLSLLCLGAGYLWCLLDRRGRYWHDYLSGTELVLLPARRDRD